MTSTMRMGAEVSKFKSLVDPAELKWQASLSEGRIPLSTFRADIDYHIGEALTQYE